MACSSPKGKPQGNGQPETPKRPTSLKRVSWVREGRKRQLRVKDEVEEKGRKKSVPGDMRKLLLPGREGVDKNCVCVCVCVRAVGGINFSRFSVAAKRNGGVRARNLNNWHCSAGAQRWQFGGGAPGLGRVGLREYKSVTTPDWQEEKFPEKKENKEDVEISKKDQTG